MRALAFVCVSAALLAGALAVLVSGTGASLVMVMMALAAGVLAILQRDRRGVYTGVALLVLALAGALVSVGNVSFENGSVLGAADEADGMAMAVAMGVLTAVAVVPVRWGDIEPRWVALAAVAAALLCTMDAFATRHNLGEYQLASNYGVLIMALASGVPAGLMAFTGPHHADAAARRVG